MILNNNNDNISLVYGINVLSQQFTFLAKSMNRIKQFYIFIFFRTDHVSQNYREICFGLNILNHVILSTKHTCLVNI